MIATAATGWPLAPDGPLHRPASAYPAACGEWLPAEGCVPAPVIQCVVHDVPVCGRCFVEAATRRRP